jgi:predicted outer membrane repeat protein
VFFIDNTAAAGGGIQNTRSHPILDNVTFTGNTASWAGGGIFNGESNPILTNVTFSNNTAVQGGGLINIMSSSPSLTYVTFNENTATETGGGMYSENNSNPTLTNVTLIANEAGSGGGMYNRSSPILKNVLFRDNGAGENGGGMYNLGDAPVLTNVVFSGNTAAAGGGGIYNDGSNPVLTNVTFNSNSAGIQGGGMSNEYSSPTIDNVILWGNGIEIYNWESVPTITDSVVQGGCPSGAACTNIITADPFFVDSANGNLHLLAASSAIDNGNDAVVPPGVTTDLDGNPRFVYTVDIGAYEYQGAEPLPFSKVAPANDAGDQSLNPTLSWDAGARAAGYEYCYYSTNPSDCAGPWTSTNEATFATISGLDTSTTYFWQVRSVNPGGTTFANSETWWSFTTVPDAPAAFGKIGPLDGALALPTSLSLSWEASASAAAYEYCFDLTDDHACSTWTEHGASTSAALSGLTPGVSYFWQVRAVNSGGATYADGETWWSFTTLSDTPIFEDVPVSYWARPFIERLYAAGVTGGCSTEPLMYCPETKVNRAQMAIFLLRGKYGDTYTPPAATGTIFNDIPSNHWAGAWIEQLYAEGITGGCGNGNYCPNTLVTREQMAIFLLRAKYGNTYTPPPATGVFSDVPADYWAAAWIEQLAAEGITGGCGGGKYCPKTIVNRAQMAVFLVKTFTLP